MAGRLGLHPQKPRRHTKDKGSFKCGSCLIARFGRSRLLLALGSLRMLQLLGKLLLLLLQLVRLAQQFLQQRLEKQLYC